MAFIWMIGSIYYYFRWEHKGGKPEDIHRRSKYPLVSILVPCHNEGAVVTETIKHLLTQQYPNFEIIAINDGSTDDTCAKLDQLQERVKRLRVIHLSENQGKGMALRAGALVARGEYLICIDGDALLHKTATFWLMRHFFYSPRVGAVTGNPRIRNRTTLMGRIQVGEYSSIIGLVKRTQHIMGRLFTVSGVVAAFRKSALQDIGYWATDTVTEDIDISWRLQLKYWNIHYEPNALCWILTPETLKGLFKQRLRWAQGGLETLIRHFREVWQWKNRRMWPIVIEQIAGMTWSYTMFLTICLWGLGQFVSLPPMLAVSSIIPTWSSSILASAALLQFTTGLIVDSRYEVNEGRLYYWIIWYPAVWWLLGMICNVIALPKVLFGKKRRSAVWTSPDRGYNTK